MGTFYYRAISPEGRPQNGSRQGASEKSVAHELQAAGLVPVYIGISPESAATSGSWLENLMSGEISLGVMHSGTRVASRDRMLFTQELATLLNAGVPLDRALTICSELTENKALRNVIFGRS